jgi:hypothetical protein
MLVMFPRCRVAEIWIMICIGIRMCWRKELILEIQRAMHVAILCQASQRLRMQVSTVIMHAMIYEKRFPAFQLLILSPTLLQQILLSLSDSLLPLLQPGQSPS